MELDKTLLALIQAQKEGEVTTAQWYAMSKNALVDYKKIMEGLPPEDRSKIL